METHIEQNSNHDKPDLIFHIKKNPILEKAISRTGATNIRALGNLANVSYPALHAAMQGKKVNGSDVKEKTEILIRTLGRILYYGAGLDLDEIRALTLGELFDISIKDIV